MRVAFCVRAPSPDRPVSCMRGAEFAAFAAPTVCVELAARGTSASRGSPAVRAVSACRAVSAARCWLAVCAVSAVRVPFAACGIVRAPPCGRALRFIRAPPCGCARVADVSCRQRVVRAMLAPCVASADRAAFSAPSALRVSLASSALPTSVVPSASHLSPAPSVLPAPVALPTPHLSPALTAPPASRAVSLASVVRDAARSGAAAWSCAALRWRDAGIEHCSTCSKANVSRETFAALSAVRAGCAGWGEASPVPRCRDDWNGALLVRRSAD